MHTPRKKNIYYRLLVWLGAGQQAFIHFARFAIFLVMVWIGGLKVFKYEADGIVHFAANSPFFSFFYKNASNKITDAQGKTVAEYTRYKNPEGKVVAQNIHWHTANGTYAFSYGLGAVIVIIGILVLLGCWFPKPGLWGGVLTCIMSVVTLSFLITTPEVYVPNLGGDHPTPHHGFPYLSGVGRLVIKDIIMMAAGLIVASDSAQKILKQ